MKICALTQMKSMTKELRSVGKKMVHNKGVIDTKNK